MKQSGLTQLVNGCKQGFREDTKYVSLCAPAIDMSPLAFDRSALANVEWSHLRISASSMK
jgi:hypothetical protein